MEGGLIFPRYPDEGLDKYPFPGSTPVYICNRLARSKLYVDQKVAEKLTSNPAQISDSLPSLASVNQNLELCPIPRQSSTLVDVIDFFRFDE